MRACLGLWGCHRGLGLNQACLAQNSPTSSLSWGAFLAANLLAPWRGSSPASSSGPLGDSWGKRFSGLLAQEASRLPGTHWQPLSKASGEACLGGTASLQSPPSLMAVATGCSWGSTEPALGLQLFASLPSLVSAGHHPHFFPRDHCVEESRSQTCPGSHALRGTSPPKPLP